MEVYRAEPGHADTLPTYLRDIPASTREVRTPNTEYRIIVRDGGNARYILTLDTRAFRKHETLVIWVLVGIIAISSLIAIWLGYAVSSTILDPIVRLASSLKAHSAFDGKLPDNIAFSARDEVSFLANRISEYKKEIHESLSREREFTGYVSHELVTPLTVVKTNATMILEDTDLPDAHGKRLRRILRATSDMMELVDAFLMIARERADSVREFSNARTVVNDVIQNMVRESDLGRIRLVEERNPTQWYPIAHRGLAIVIRNLVVNALVYTEGLVTVKLDRSSLSVIDSGTQGEYSSATVRRRGLGMHIVRRICENYGLLFDGHLDPSAGSCFSVTIPHDAAGTGE
jgi:signal transduction histidine kinase